MSIDLDLSDVQDVADLIDVLETQISDGELIESVIDDTSDEVVFETVMNAVLADKQAVSYNGKGLPSSINFKADGKQGSVHWTYDDYRVTRVEMNYPGGDPFFRFVINWKSNEYQIDSVELELYQEEAVDSGTTP